MRSSQIIALVGFVAMAAAILACATAEEPHDGGTTPTPAPTLVTHGAFVIVPAGRADAPEKSLARAIVGERRKAAYEPELSDDIHAAVPGVFPGRLISMEFMAGVDDVGPFEIYTTLGYETEPGERRGINIVRWRPRLPFPVPEPVRGGALRLELGTIGGVEAVFIVSATLRPGEEGSIDIWWIEDGVLTQLDGGGTLEGLREIAESIAAADARQ